MFDNVGTNPDQDAGRRTAASVVFTLLLSGSCAGFLVGVAAYQAVETVLEGPEPELQLVEVDLADEGIDEALPPPPPPPAAGRSSADEQEIPEPSPDEMNDDVAELDDSVKDKVEDAAAAGTSDGVDGGDPDGQPDGVIGGDPDGETGGELGSGVQAFHHLELQTRRTPAFRYPEAARSQALGDQRCLAEVYIDESGVPYDAIVRDCPSVFHAETKQTLLRWRWYPPRDDADRKTKGRATYAVRFKLR